MRNTGVNPETNMHTKLIAFIKLANIHLNHFPNHEKFGLCTQIRNCMYDVYKKTTLHNFSKAVKLQKEASIISILGHAKHSSSHKYLISKLGA